MEKLNYKQETVKIGEIDVPIIIEGGVKYYPISFIVQKILLRHKNGLIPTQEIRNGYNDIKLFEIKYGENNYQNSNCISESSLIKRLEKTQQGRLSVEKRKNQNILHTYLKIPLLTEKEVVINSIPDEEFNLHDPFTKDVITDIVNTNKDVKFMLCSDCEKYHPMDSKFYNPDSRNAYGFAKICRVCTGHIKHFTNNNSDKNRIYKQTGYELYSYYTSNDIYKIYKSYLKEDLNFLPECYCNKESYLTIIKEMIVKEDIQTEELSMDILTNKYKLHSIHKKMSIYEIHEYLFGEECHLYPWKYKNLPIKKNSHTFEKAKVIFNNYIKEHEIEITDIFNFNYVEVMISARIRINNSLGFVVDYYDRRYAGYKFKTKTSNYYNFDENVLLDLKYLIEEDMKIEIHKIPLYLTKTYLQRNVTPMYNFIVTKSNGSIYEWVSKLYPDQFTPYDFDINYYRDNFDSNEEAQVHDVLMEHLSNVMYNARNQKRTVTIKGMQPDWIVIGEEKCWFVEYFGLYSNNPNTVVTTYYAELIKKKVDIYENELTEYGKVYIYPDDLKRNFEGVREKIKIIK